jgi:benzoyl-CoA reductase subunit C
MQQGLPSEDRLQRLLSANSPEERNKWALQWKEQGKKVIGMIDYYVPEEVIWAAGMLPWRLTGTWEAATPLAEVWRLSNLDVSCNHILESFLKGEYGFLDGAIFTDWDDDVRRLYDVLDYLDKFPFVKIIHIPNNDTELACQYYRRSLFRLVTQLEDLGQTAVSEQSLHQAIETCGTTRSLLRKVYELRKRDVPPLSGSETLKLVTAAQVMPKDVFNQELSELLPYVEERRASVSQTRPRLLVASDRLDHPGYLELIERAGAVVAMDDMDTGSRYVWTEVHNTIDPLFDLARSYLRRPACPRMSTYTRQVDKVIEWVKEYNIDGVLNFPHMYGFARLYTAPHFRETVSEAGIPISTFTRQYHLADEGALMTRIGAFVETLHK